MSRTICFIGAAICATVFSACTLTSGETNEGQITLYVSQKGNDAWSGRKVKPGWTKKDGPFKTIERARRAIHEIKRSKGGLNTPVTVLLDDGTYYQQETLTFTPEDSGTSEAPITYKAIPGATPVISGGYPLTGWQQDTSEQSRIKCDGKLWCLKLPENPTGNPWHFNQLYVNGERRTRARSPNRGSFFRSAGPTGTNSNREIFYNEGDVKHWKNLRQVIFTIYHSWETSLHHVHNIDEDAGIVTFREPAPWPMGQWEKQQRYYVEGIFEGLDQPGEWYLDPSESVLYYYPLPGESAESINAIAPLVRSTLIEFKGEPSRGLYVDHLRFEGISFKHTDANLTEFRNPGQGEIYQPALIMATGLRNSTFESCEISCAGAHAIWLASGCSNTTIRKCHLHSLGGGGVYIGGGWGVGKTAPASSNTVDNCFIHNAGNLFHGAHGVWIGKSSYNKITHNEIKNLDYSGISCGWSWGFQPTSANHNNIDFNHIHHLSNGEGLSDMGGIYTLGVSPGTTERYNIIHDVYNYEHVSHGSGLYLDEGSSEILMENNLVYRVRNSPLFMHYGADCTVRNNILALGGHGQLRRCREDKRCHYNAIGNIVYSDHPQMLDGPWKNKDWHIERNLYWCTSGTPDFAGRTFAEWQAEGNDKGSIIADPLFKDPANGDFTLKPGSPAEKIGFKPIDYSKAGLYGEKAWTSLPDKYPDRKLVEIAKPITVPISINYDFEGYAKGSKPIDAKVHESGGAIVSIVDIKAEAVADSKSKGPTVAEVRDLGGGVTDPALQRGKQCLKFQDAPGARYRWLPHLEYRRTYTAGKITLSWDMLNSRKQPADFLIELREYTGGSYITGTAISISEDGTVKASGRDVGKIPLGVWVKADIELTAGEENSGKYRMELTIPGQEKIVKEIPYSNPKFKNITWLGLMSNSDKSAAFYIDNLRMGTAEELKNPPRRRIKRTAQSGNTKPYGKDRLVFWSGGQPL